MQRRNACTNMRTTASDSHSTPGYMPGDLYSFERMKR